MPSLALSFYVGAAISVISAILCAMQGEHYVHEIHGESAAAATGDPQESSGKSAR